MSDTGWIDPGTVVSDSSVGTVSWNNPSNADDSDNTYAIAEGLTDMGDIKDKVVKLVDETGSLVGDNNADTVSLWSLTDDTSTYGASDDDWNNTWSASDINDSDFGVVFQATGGIYGSDSEYLKATNFSFNIPSGATIDGIEVRIEKKYVAIMFSDAYVDNIQIKVYYTESSGTQANAERGLYLSGVDSESSERNLYLQGKLSSSAEIELYLEGVVNNLYSRENASGLETDDTNLGTVFSEQDYTDVSSDDDVFVEIDGVEQYSKFLFKEYNSNDNNLDYITINWKGKSSLAPSSATVYLQIYNRTDEVWENLDSDNSSSADTKFTLESTVNTDLSDYYNENYVINCRIYQEVT